MKKVLVRVLGAVAAVIVLAVAALVVKFYVLSPKMRPAPDLKASSDPAVVARGKYLVNHVAACIGCHSPVREDVAGEPPVEGKVGAGRDFGVWEGVPFHLRAPNITPDEETGIGAWTDGEIARAIREGVSRDGRPLFPQMPYLTYRDTMSDADTLAILSYLRTLTPVKNDAGRTDIQFPVSMFVRAAPAPLETPSAGEPPASDKLARGKWLLRAASCKDCHDAFDAHRNPIPGKELAGGFKFPMAGGKYVVAPNITSDKATGIGAYSDEDLRRVFDEGKGKDGRSLFVMPWSYYKGMTDEDKDALVFALRQAAPVANVVPPSNR